MGLKNTPDIQLPEERDESGQYPSSHVDFDILSNLGVETHEINPDHIREEIDMDDIENADVKNLSHPGKETFPDFDITKSLKVEKFNITINEITKEDIKNVEQTWFFLELLEHFNQAHEIPQIRKNKKAMDAKELLRSRSSFHAFMEFVNVCRIKKYLIIEDDCKDDFLRSMRALREKYSLKLSSLQQYYDEIINTIYRQRSEEYPKGRGKENEEVRDKMDEFTQAYSLVKVLFKGKNTIYGEDVFEHLKGTMEIVLRKKSKKTFKEIMQGMASLTTIIEIIVGIRPFKTTKDNDPDLDQTVLALLHNVTTNIPEYADVIRRIYGDAMADYVNELTKPDWKDYLNLTEKEQWGRPLYRQQTMLNQAAKTLTGQYSERASTAVSKMREDDLIDAMDNTQKTMYMEMEDITKPYKDVAKEIRDKEYFDHLDILSPKALSVRFADRLHNLRHISRDDKNKIGHLVEETETYFLPLAKARKHKFYKPMKYEIEVLKKKLADNEIDKNHRYKDEKTPPKFDREKFLSKKWSKWLGKEDMQITITRIPEGKNIEDSWFFIELLRRFNKIQGTELSMDELLYSRSSFHTFMDFVMTCHIKGYLVIQGPGEDPSPNTENKKQKVESKKTETSKGQCKDSLPSTEDEKQKEKKEIYEALRAKCEDTFMQSIQALRVRHSLNLSAFQKYADEIVRTIYRPQGFGKEHKRVRDELDKFAQAYSLMRMAFNDKHRESGEKYFRHLEGTMEIVLRELPNPSIEKVLIALLHDVIEDVPEYVDVIRKFYGDKIADGVNALSKKDWKLYMTPEEKKETQSSIDEQEDILNQARKTFTDSYADRAYTAPSKIKEKELIKVMNDEQRHRYLQLKKETKPYEEEAKRRREKDYFGHLRTLENDILDVKFADRLHNLRDTAGIDRKKALNNVRVTKEYFLDVARERNRTAYRLMVDEINKIEAKYPSHNIPVVGIDGLHRAGKGTQLELLENFLKENGCTPIIMKGHGTRDGLGIHTGDPASLRWQKNGHTLKDHSSPEFRKLRKEAAARLQQEFRDAYAEIQGKSLVNPVILLDRTIISRLFAERDHDPDFDFNELLSYLVPPIPVTPATPNISEKDKEHTQHEKRKTIIPDLTFVLNCDTKTLLGRFVDGEIDTEKGKFKQKNIVDSGPVFDDIIQDLPGPIKQTTRIINGEKTIDEVHKEIVQIFTETYPEYIKKNVA